MAYLFFGAVGSMSAYWVSRKYFDFN